MCGIAGIAQGDARPVDRELLLRMTRSLAHRGPDDEGLWVGAGIGLGHRRLSIVDLSPEGNQPMSNEDGSVWVSYNGEIYNFAELRARLVARGHTFRSHSDTEVLVHLYEEHGADLVHELRGMFAFALWDVPRRRLLLARDRLGIKPLFYCEHQGSLRFGSEIKALLADPSVPRELDDQALDDFLAQNYVGAPTTLLRQVRQLEPGELLEFGPDQPLRRRRWWDLEFAPATPRSEREWTDAVEAALRDAVRTHLMADVPYGALLSGGLDSATLVGVLVQEHQADTLTFTAEFQEATFGEGQRARAVASALGAENQQVLFRAPTLAQLEQIVTHAEEPTADMSMLPFHAVCGLARTRVKVALSGEGADEVFAGYLTYPASLVAAGWRRVPAPARALVRRAVHALRPSEGKVSTMEKLQRFLRGAEVPGEAAHFAWRQICSPALRRELHARPGARAAVSDVPAGGAVFAHTDARAPLDRLLYADLRHYLPNDMLVKADRMSMAHGLEIRVPYLDHRLVELAATMPARLKLRRLHQGKWILRQVAERVLPPAAQPPRRKLGFNVPFGSWLRGPLREVVGDVLAPARVRAQGLLSPSVVERIFAEHQRGERDRTYELYAVLILSLWYDWIGRSQALAPARAAGGRA